MGRSDVIGEVAAEGRADPAGQPEAVVGDLIQARAGHDAADLGLLAEREQVGQHSEMLAAPLPSGHPHAALHFVEDEEHIVLVADLAQRLEEFTPEMVVSPFPLNRLDNNRGDVVALLRQDLPDPVF